MKQNYPKQYLILVYYSPIEDILLYIVRCAFSKKDAIAQARAYFKRDKDRTLPDDVMLRVVQLPTANAVKFVGHARIYNLPALPTKKDK